MKFLIDVVVVIVVASVGIFLYLNYWDDFKDILFQDEAHYTIYVGSVAVDLTVADEHDERVLGLSGVSSLGDSQGELFIFDNDAKHGMWMKDMLIPIDIIWIDKQLQVIHILENVQPSTYPEVFAPPADARFVVEMNAHFVSSLKLKVGDRLTLPPSLLPSDIKNDLQQ